MQSQQGLVKVALVVGIIVLVLIGADVGVATIQRVSGPSTLGPQGVVSGLAAALGAGAAASHTISTNGVGSVTLTPNEVKITIGALTQGSTAQSASNANSNIINAVLTQLSSLGITNSSISTTTFSISPQYDSRTNPPSLIGYQVSHQLQVTITGPSISQLSTKVGQVIDAAVGAGANQVSSVVFTVSDQTLKSASDQALQLAIQDTSSRAQLIASALGVKITGVDSVSSNVYAPNTSSFQVTAGVSGGGTTILPGNFTVTSSVQVTYDI